MEGGYNATLQGAGEHSLSWLMFILLGVIWLLFPHGAMLNLETPSIDPSGKLKAF